MADERWLAGFTPLLDAAHAVDLIASDGPRSYRLQIKSLEAQEEDRLVPNVWKGRHIDYVIYFAQRSNWGYVCPAFVSNQKRLKDPTHKKFQQNAKSFLAAFHTCARGKPGAITLPWLVTIDGLPVHNYAVESSDNFVGWTSDLDGRASYDSGSVTTRLRRFFSRQPGIAMTLPLGSRSIRR